METISARDLDRRLADLVRSERHLVVQFVVELAAFAKRELYRELGYTSLFLLLRSPARALEVVRLQAIGSGSPRRAVPSNRGSTRRRAAVDTRYGRAARGAD